MASNSVEVLGLKEALRELNTMDKKLRREITRDFKQIVQPVITDAKQMLPSGAPLSGMARSWKGKSGADIMSWSDNRVRRNLSAFTSGKKVKESPSGTMQNRFGNPSRVIYRAYRDASDDVERQVKELVNKVMKLTNNAMRIR